MSRRRAPVIRVNMQSPYLGDQNTAQAASQAMRTKQFIANHIDEINRILDMIQTLLASSDDPRAKYLKDMLGHFKLLLRFMYPPTNSVGQIPVQIPVHIPVQVPDQGPVQGPVGYMPNSLPPPMEQAPPQASKPDWRAVLEKLENMEPSTSKVREDWGDILGNIKSYVDRSSEDRPPP